MCKNRQEAIRMHNRFFSEHVVIVGKTSVGSSAGNCMDVDNNNLYSDNVRYASLRDHFIADFSILDAYNKTVKSN